MSFAPKRAGGSAKAPPQPQTSQGGQGGQGGQAKRLSQSQQEILEEHKIVVSERIGVGAFGDVWKGFSSELQCLVAVKVVNKQKAPDEFLTHFLPREMDIIRAMEHPNIIKYLFSIETNKNVNIVMEVATGGTLLNFIRKERYLDEHTGAIIFRQLIAGMYYMHEKGIIHRDLKCENLLIDKHGTLKIIDFGFARAGFDINVEETKPTNQLCSTFCGSYAYACPEILKGVPYEGHLSDIWSMAVILFTMLYGRLPFDDSNLRVLVRQVQEPVEFPNNPPTSYDCKRLINRMLKPAHARIYIPEIKKDKWYLTF